MASQYIQMLPIPLIQIRSALIPIASFGEPMTLMALTRGNLSREYLSSDGNAYEFILRGNDLGHNYTIALRCGPPNVQKTVFNYVISTIGEMLMIALFVTIVLMLTIGYWLLEPILFMRSNLMEASRNPENPNIPKSRTAQTMKLVAPLPLLKNSFTKTLNT